MGMLMSAKFDSACPKCNGSIEKCDLIQFDKVTRTVLCQRCVDEFSDIRPDLGRLFDMAYEDQCAAACGLDGQDRGN